MTKYNRTLIYPGLLLVLALSLILMAGCGSGSGDQVPESGGKDLTEFTTESLNGETVNQNIFKDNDVTMINFWATYCGPCIDEMPDLGEIYREHEGTGFSIIGIVMDVQNSDLSVIDDKVAEADSIIAETKADYRHLLVSEDIVIDMITPYQISSIPTTFFVDSTGKVIDGPYIGSRSKAEWEKIIEDVTK